MTGTPTGRPSGQQDGLRLATGHVAVVVGPADGRRRLLDRLDDATARCAGGQGGVLLARVTGPLDLVDGLGLRDNLALRTVRLDEGPDGPRWDAALPHLAGTWPGLAERLDDPARDLSPVDRCRAALLLAGLTGARVVVVDGLTDGLTAAERRVVLRSLPAVAAWPAAVLVADADPAAAVAVADSVLQVAGDGGTRHREPELVGAALPGA